MRKLLFLIIACASAVVFSLASGAEQDKNLMAAYNEIAWEGDVLSYEKDYGTLSFDEKSGKSSVTFPTESSTGMWFYFDMGNLSNKGTGFVAVDFLDMDGAVIETIATEKNNGNGSFNRYELGSSEEYFGVPENAASVRITLNYTEGEQSPYFRNFSLVFSNNRTVNSSLKEWDVSGKLQIVQVGVTRADHITWIIFVVLAALIMFGTRKILDRTKNIKNYNK